MLKYSAKLSSLLWYIQGCCLFTGAHFKRGVATIDQLAFRCLQENLCYAPIYFIISENYSRIILSTYYSNIILAGPYLCLALPAANNRCWVSHQQQLNILILH